MFEPASLLGVAARTFFRDGLVTAAGAGAAAARRFAGHGAVVAGDLRRREQVVVDGHLGDRALEPRVAGHRAHFDRAVVGHRDHAVLAEAARLAVRGLVPRDAVDPDVDRAGI